MAMDIYQIVADRILEELEKGIIPWQKPWHGAQGGAYNLVSKRPYSFINQILLKHQDAYVTYKQAKDLGGNVKKGAKSEMVVFWKMFPSKTETEKDENGNDVPKLIPMLRYYNVFWIGDCEGITVESVEPIEHDPIEEAENIITAYIEHEGIKLRNTEATNEAYYSPASDAINVPCLSQYEIVEEYYSTLFHEMTHSTGHPKRLNRINTKAAFGSDDYGKEELVAEMGAAMLVNICGIESSKSFRNSTAYIQNWMNAIKADKRLVVSAAGKAEKAVRYIQLEG